MSDEQTIAEHAPHGHPLIAVLTGGAVLVLAAIAAPRLLPPQPFALLLGAGFVLGILLWLAGFVWTIRRAEMGWRLGSLALLAVAGGGAGLVANSQFQSRARADASSFADLELTADGTPQFPADAAGRGPISQHFAQVAAAEQQAEHSYDEGLKRLGVGALNSPYTLGQDPRAIADCSAFTALRQQAEAAGADRAKARTALRQAITGAQLAEGAKKGIATMAGTDGAVDPRLQNRLAMLDATHQLCVLLAKKSWSNAGGYFGFASAADMATFRQLQAQRQSLAAEAEGIDRAERARMIEGRDAVRQALSESIFFAH